jgi:hypothetical protein
VETGAGHLTALEYLLGYLINNTDLATSYSFIISSLFHGEIYSCVHLSKQLFANASSLLWFIK